MSVESDGTQFTEASRWPEMLAGDDVLATAILDRLLHHRHVVNIDGRSFRLKSMETQVDNR